VLGKNLLVHTNAITLENLQTNAFYFFKFFFFFLAEIKLEQDPSVSHLTSLVLFAHRTSKLFEVFSESVLTPELFEASAYGPMPFSGDKTSFSVALKLLHSLLEKEASRIPAVIIILSDGDDAFPQKELQKLGEDDVRKRIDSLWTIGIGAKATQGTLLGIAQWMEKGEGEKSHFSNPQDYTELVDHYAEIANET
jgi:hypothetical protein